MRIVRQKVRHIVVNPLILSSFTAAVLLVLGGWFWLADISYEYPGPALAVGLLGVAVFLIGLAFSDLRGGKSPETSDQRNADSPHLPRVVGLARLVDRWQMFNPSEEDRQILDEQIQIVLSTAQRHYNTYDEIRLLEYFRGAKLKGGAFLLTISPNITPLVWKFDSLTNINREIRNYRHCVREFLGNTPGEAWEPRQRYGTMGTEDWGLIAYNFVGRGTDPAALKQLQTFGDYYLSHVESQNAGIIRQIFKALEPWWLMRRGWPEDCRRGGLRSLYDEYNRLSRYRAIMRQELQSVGRQQQIAVLENLDFSTTYLDLGVGEQLRNPFNWLAHVFETKKLDVWSVQHRQDSIVHGDFHSGNILIEDGDPPKIRLIDFPHVHVGPTVQDIARLEADLKFSLLADESLQRLGLRGLWERETALLPIKPVESDLPAILTAAPERKTWCTVQLLRSEAQRYNIIGSDARPYYLALLHATLPILYYGDRSPWQKLYAFVAASLLCKQLEARM
ncbi:MAG: phosphotransferase [Anaerolineaceae bacterium]|nr:phosphotransferase [Anaerolineaceae bacterium]MCB9099177.1 phosphotransferase [Anaerolineales bacterium]